MHLRGDDVIRCTACKVDGYAISGNGGFSIDVKDRGKESLIDKNMLIFS